MKTGVIGLGAMGRGMALNLHKAGHLRGVWNRTRGKAAGIVEETGAVLYESPADLASECELVLLCVSRDADVLEMDEDADVLDGAGCVDCSVRVDSC